MIKGAVLSHGNMIGNVAGGSLEIKFYPSDVYISYLPLAHIYERSNQKSVYEKDAKKIMNSLISLEELQTTGDISWVRRFVQFFLDNFLNQSPDQQTTLAAIGEPQINLSGFHPTSHL
ncbi:hypothetical protein L2E82_39339 [Cichorium intybus]|uniref:Uncharacterized protein n=1 Tax=Cichorium intybus TaxID=13427 RepID=A0ACB9AI95_CICIN|nr:hypothetical protein L2E82_39339 [Cichorium intybus]